MPRRAVALLFLGALAGVADAWSAAGLPRRSAAVAAARGVGLLAGLGAPRRARSSLSLAADAVASGGECAVTPEVPESLPVDDSVEYATLSRKPEAGDVITFTLLRFEPSDGPTDALASREPLFDSAGTQKLVLDGGNYLPGLHKLLSTMTPGETVEGTAVDAGYGKYDPALEFKIETSTIGDAIDSSLVKVGTQLRMGNGMDVRVTELTDEAWTLDANHPLAGASYDVDVRLDAVEDGPLSGKGSRYAVATFALGCFWGGELAYQRVPGVVSTSVGYTQGQKENPTYEEVCTGATGHTEAIQVVYDPDVVPYSSLVKLGLDRLGDDVYKLNQVGNDRGTQYRHGVYYHNDEQKGVADKMLADLGSAGREVMTELKVAQVFYEAEDYHQQYLLKGGQSARKGASESIRCYG